MSFQHSTTWTCQFLEADLKTPLPRKFSSTDVEKVREIVRRGNGLPNLEAGTALEHGITMGRGGVWLNLTDEQYQKLRAGKQ
jgi:hypothetical protein